ncbi:MAG: class I SAM-dependent methyltransferase [Deltaproteobacteria bacterium]|nr:MAG: class I SAM-dependent methyltransferase [Deltaproteobacteria bacterium]
MRAAIYDTALIPLTAGWYKHVLDHLEPGSHLLDIGIGTGGALCKNAETVTGKDIRVTGVDIDAAYVKKATKRVAKQGLDDRVNVLLESIYDHQGGPYDAAYFSASFMLLPDPAAALQHVLSLLTPDGRVFFTQTFQDRPSPFMEKAKPLLKKLTTIDFGQVTYEEDFRDTVANGGLTLDSLEVIGTQGPRSFRLAIGHASDA